MTYTEAVSELLELYNIHEEPCEVIVKMYTFIGMTKSYKYPVRLQMLISALNVCLINNDTYVMHEITKYTPMHTKYTIHQMESYRSTRSFKSIYELEVL